MVAARTETEAELTRMRAELDAARCAKRAVEAERDAERRAKQKAESNKMNAEAERDAERRAKQKAEGNKMNAEAERDAERRAKQKAEVSKVHAEAERDAERSAKQEAERSKAELAAIMTDKLQSAELGKPCVKGKVFEMQLCAFIKQAIAPLIASGSVTVKETARTPHTADLQVLMGGKPIVVIDAKWYSKTVPSEGINKLIRDKQTTGATGAIIVSKQSPITSGNNAPRTSASFEDDVLYMPNITSDMEDAEVWIRSYTLMHMLIHRGNIDGAKSCELKRQLAEHCKVYNAQHRQAHEVAIQSARLEKSMRDTLEQNIADMLKSIGAAPNPPKRQRAAIAAEIKRYAACSLAHEQARGAPAAEPMVSAQDGEIRRGLAVRDSAHAVAMRAAGRARAPGPRRPPYWWNRKSIAPWPDAS